MASSSVSPLADKQQIKASDCDVTGTGCIDLLTNTTSSNGTQQHNKEIIYRLGKKVKKNSTTTAPATAAAVAAAPAAPDPPQPTPLSPSCCTPQKFDFPLPEARRFPDQSMQKNLCLGSTLV